MVFPGCESELQYDILMYDILTHALVILKSIDCN